MASTANIGRFRGRTMLTLAAIGSLAACSPGLSGTATTEPYQPLDPGTVQVTEVELDRSTIGVAPDLSATVIVSDGKTCLVPQDGEGEGAERQGTVCADLPQDSRPVSAVFAPDGSRYAVFPDANRFDISGTWIVEADTGEAVRVQMDDIGEAGSAPGTSASTPSGTTTSGRTGSDDGGTRAVEEVLQGGMWRSNEELVGFGRNFVLRIDPDSGDGEVLYVVPGGDFIWMYAVGGNTAVVLQETELTAVDLDTGTAGSPIKIAEDRIRPVLLGVSPDGRTALVSTSDVRAFKAGPTRLVSLQDGSGTELDLPADTFTFGGSFSPDGTQIVLFSGFNGEGLPAGDNTGAPETSDGPDDSNGGSDPLTIVTAAADGTGLRAIGSSGSSPYGPMTWSRHNVLSVDPRMAPSRAAWQLSAG